MTSCRGAVLLHLCCAPCGTVGWTGLLDERWDVTAFFWGGNIQPQDEWLRRREAVERLAAVLGRSAVVSEWEPERWREATAGLEDEPEGGRRCLRCYELQLETAAETACRLGIDRLCTSLTTSRQKNPSVINHIGRAVANRYDLEWEERVWRKNDGVRRSEELSRRWGLYRQTYCGCLVSLEASEKRRARRGEP